MFNLQNQQSDIISNTLRRCAQNILLVVFGLLPLFFIPTATAPFEYTKVIMVTASVFIALVLVSLSILRLGTVVLSISYTLCAFWTVAGIAFVSSIFSGDLSDSLVGDFFSIHTTAFVALLALISTTVVLLKSSKVIVMRMYMLIATSTILLVLFHLLRIFIGPEFLSFGIFTNTVATPVGGWNDLALFLGLAVILSLLALEQLSLTKIGKGLFVVVVILALFMLAVINFFTVWIVLGLTSLAMIVYSLGRNKFTDNQMLFNTTSTFNKISLITTFAVFAVSVLFIVGGPTLGGVISKLTNISYVEVRPSFEATADIAQNVYRENAFFGVGPNRFTDAWRFYKDNSINLTPFWNTDFTAGNGYLTSFFVTTGVLGGIAWIVFLGIFTVTGVRRLLAAIDGDRMWFFIGLSSFVSAVYIWGMSVVYVPGAVILMLGALCLGTALTAFSELSRGQEKTVSIDINRRTGFILTFAVILVIIGSISVLYSVGQHYSSIVAFNKSIQMTERGDAIDDIEQKISAAYKLSSSDIFARRIAEYEYTRMQNILKKTSPSESDQVGFKNAMELGISSAQDAIRIDGGESLNWLVLGNIYSLLASINVEGAHDKALEALHKAQELNPKNPLPYLEVAIVEGRAGNVDAARSNIESALNVKPNFTEAFYFLSQLEIAVGNVEKAIQSTEATIALDPQNAARYYQLGVLQSANNSVDKAISAFEHAIEIDQNYANARYLLALAYDMQGRSADAKKQLEAVLSLNPGNAEVTALIKTIDTEGSLLRLRENQGTVAQMVNENNPTASETGTISTTGTLDTPLVSPVNTTSKTESSVSGTQQ